LDFPPTTDVGRLVPNPDEEDAQRRRRGELREPQKAGREVAGVRGGGTLRSRSASSSSPPLHGFGRRRVIMEMGSFVFPFLICFVISLVRPIFLGQARAEDKGELQRSIPQP